MSINTTKLLSGRAPVVPYDELDSTRYEFLSLGQAEPSLGSGVTNNVLTLGADNARVWSDSISIATGNFSGNIGTFAIFTDNYLYANGQPFTPGTNYSNANVANYLPVFNGNISVKNILSNNNSNITFLPDGTGIVVIADTEGGATGIQLGANTSGQLVSNAVVLTTGTSVTNSIAELNLVLGKLVPPRPPAFPANTTLTISTATTAARMCAGFTQPNNTTTGNKAVAAGTLVNAVRTSTYATNTVSNAGPGDAGTITVYLNSTASGNVTLNPNASPSGNGTYSNLVISANEDYHVANANIAANFWYVFSSQATGTVPSGWNEVYIADTVAGNTNTPNWYYDSSTASAPVFSSNTITPPGSPSLTYSSTIPHYNNGTTFNIGFNVNNLSGNMYPNNGNLITNNTAAGGAFLAPATVTYAAANVTVPLTQNLYVGSGNATVATTAGIISGFGSSATGPTVTVTNSYNATTHTFAPTGTVLYKTGTGTAIDESNIVIGSTIGSGSGNGFRIVNPGTGNTPAYTGTESAFDSQTGPLYAYDAIVIGNGSQGVLTWSNINYSAGAYLPVGPNLSTQQATQYFTFKFVRSATSKFDIQIAGTVGGVWVALPGSVFDTFNGSIGPTSDLNGWLNMSLPYGGAGVPGAISANGGNGSDGCSLGGAIPINTAINGRYTCTFGTVSSSSTSTHEIYVRIRLTSGQSVTALSLQTASN